MFRDAVGAADSLHAGVSGYSPPNWPCPACGKETVEHRMAGAPDDERWRICTHSGCRHEYQSDQASVLA